MWGVYCTLPRPLTALFHSLMTTFTWLSSATFYLFSHTFLPFLSSILFTDPLLFSISFSPCLSLWSSIKNSLYLFMFLIPPQLPKTLFLTLKKSVQRFFFSNYNIFLFSTIVLASHLLPNYILVPISFFSPYSNN